MYYDTVVVANMFRDIITDIGAMIQGGLGVNAGGNINRIRAAAECSSAWAVRRRSTPART